MQALNSYCDMLQAKLFEIFRLRYNILSTQPGFDRSVALQDLDADEALVRLLFSRASGMITEAEDRWFELMYKRATQSDDPDNMFAELKGIEIGAITQPDEEEEVRGN